MAEIAFSAINMALSIYDKIVQASDRRSASATLPVDVGEAKDLLTEMQASLRDSESRFDGGSNLLQQCVKNVENLAYDIEDALADYLLHIPNRRGLSEKVHDAVPILPGNKIKNANSKLSSDMTCIKQKLESFRTLRNALLQPSSSSERKEDWPEQIYLAEGDQIVGFETRNEELFTQLTGTDQLTILIAGPGGSGKSTMVKNIYLSEKISNEGFGCHAWVHVPGMKLEKQLLKILSQNEARRQQGKDDEKEEENDPKEKLRQLLQRKKFLLVLDNVWSKTDLEIIQNLFSKGLPGSKIIITTRRSDVTSDPSYIHDLSSGLSSDRAKVLFCRKAFQKQEWPSVIKTWATTILNMCDGMPLAISEIGALLASKPIVPVVWKTVHDTLGSQICQVDSGLYVLYRSLQPSYRELPSNVKPCFLYFSMFPHDHSVSRKRLIRLWVAEGFVMSERTQLAEKMAADILDDLIKRNLVVARTMEVDGRLVRRYLVLHLVREINISRRESFLTVLEPNSHPSGDKIRRLSVNNGTVKLIKGRTTRTRTLLVFGLASKSPIYDLDMILKTCKFLRVLDLQGLTGLEKFPDHVFGLTLLKYLSLKGTQIKIVPKSIKKLVDLETLDLRQTDVTCLPNEICKLEKLRHLLLFCKDVRSSGGVDLSPAAGNHLGALSSMQTLSRLKVGNNSGILTALGELTGLRKLGLTDLQREDGLQLCSSLQNMEALSTLDVRATSKDMHLDLDHMTSPLVNPRYLEHLHMEGRLARVPRWVLELTSLTKIGLKLSKLTPVGAVNPLEPLQGLPTLMELDLVDYFSGDQLVFGAQTFEKLMILRMEQFDQLNSVKIEDGAMPQLKELTMRKCKNLMELPDGIEGLNLLDEIRCNDMPHEFVARLRSHGQNFPRIRIISP